VHGLKSFLVLVLISFLIGGHLAAQTPRLLLTPQRLKRLQRDRERQTDRWRNFEKRVKSVPDSPERGFELALYSAISADRATARAAVDWALAHPCEQRQVALVLDWAGAQASASERASLLKKTCASAAGRFEQMRNHLFLEIVNGDPPSAEGVQLTDVPPARELYALAEYLDVYRSSQADDLRQQDVAFYMQLPATYLLSLQPREIEHPTWQQHVTALALVTLDPNMQGSQFLQGWAMEDRFSIQNGPGVAYELLWANAYLPGVGYQNMEPWVYWDGRGRFWARSDWSQTSCWMHFSSTGVQQENCPAGWQQQVMQFGHMFLIPMTERCVTLPVVKRDQTTLLRTLAGDATVTYTEEKGKHQAQTDAAGMWHVPENIQGKVCLAPDHH
jgi:hypothetical protein